MYILYNTRKEFVSGEFRGSTNSVNSTVIEQPVELPNLLGKIKRYYLLLRRAFQIISREYPDFPKKARLQIAVKAVNNTAGPNSLTPTLLVYGTYPRIAWSDAPPASVAARGKVIKNTIAEVRKVHARNQVRDALRIRNRPNILYLTKLPLNAEVIVYRRGNRIDC